MAKCESRRVPAAALRLFFVDAEKDDIYSLLREGAHRCQRAETQPIPAIYIIGVSRKLLLSLRLGAVEKMPRE